MRCCISEGPAPNHTTIGGGGSEAEESGRPEDMQDGSRYQGMWQEGFFHGVGVLEAMSSRSLRYAGEFHYGHQHGVGVLEEEGRVYRGEFKDGMKSGFGVEEILHGERETYMGEFKAGMRHGIGMLKSPAHCRRSKRMKMAYGRWERGERTGDEEQLVKSSAGGLHEVLSELNLKLLETISCLAESRRKFAEAACCRGSSLAVLRRDRAPDPDSHPSRSGAPTYLVSQLKKIEAELQFETEAHMKLSGEVQEARKQIATLRSSAEKTEEQIRVKEAAFSRMRLELKKLERETEKQLQDAEEQVRVQLKLQKEKSDKEFEEMKNKLEGAIKDLKIDVEVLRRREREHELQVRSKEEATLVFSFQSLDFESNPPRTRSNSPELQGPR
eukprot:748038-Hanusia_phi.AAC.1